MAGTMRLPELDALQPPFRRPRGSSSEFCDASEISPLCRRLGRVGSSSFGVRVSAIAGRRGAFAAFRLRAVALKDCLAATSEPPVFHTPLAILSALSDCCRPRSPELMTEAVPTARLRPTPNRWAFVDVGLNIVPP